MTTEYDASNITITVNGNSLTDIETIGYDQSKTHEIQKTLDGNAVWVDGIGEYSGTFAIKAVSSDVKNVESLFQDDTVFNIQITYPPNEGRTESTIKNCIITDFAPGDYELEGMPTYEADWEAPEISHSS